MLTLYSPLKTVILLSLIKKDYDIRKLEWTSIAIPSTGTLNFKLVSKDGSILDITKFKSFKHTCYYQFNSDKIFNHDRIDFEYKDNHKCYNFITSSGNLLSSEWFEYFEVTLEDHNFILVQRVGDHKWNLLKRDGTLLYPEWLPFKIEPWMYGMYWLANANLTNPN